jgi:hypothetical protein
LAWRQERALMRRERKEILDKEKCLIVSLQIFFL